MYCVTRKFISDPATILEKHIIERWHVVCQQYWFVDGEFQRCII
ncbi:MAG: hypothetical protein WCG45_03215 [bacterium]